MTSLAPSAVTAPTPERGALTGAALFTFLAAAAVVITPLSVFAVDWVSIDPGYASPDYVRDPIITSRQAWIGVIYAFQALLFATSISIAAVRIAPILGPRSFVRVGVGAAFAAATLNLVLGGSSAAMYSTGLWRGLEQLQPDADIRKMIGFADLLVTQGVAGAAGIAVAVWLLSVAAIGRSSSLVGRWLTVVVGVFAALMIVLYGSGFAAATTLVAAVPLLVTAIALFVASRKRVIR